MPTKPRYHNAYVVIQKHKHTTHITDILRAFSSREKAEHFIKMQPCPETCTLDFEKWRIE